MRALVADIGGTNARFAIAEVERHGRLPELSAVRRLRTADHGSFEDALRAYLADVGGTVPKVAALAVATLVDGDLIKLTNAPWAFSRSETERRFGLERLLVLNDFGAIGYAVASLGPEHFADLRGGGATLAGRSPVSIVGAGTGLGVALLIGKAGERPQVVETEGGHIGFSPVDSTEDALHARLRARFGRVSVERLASGPGLRNILEALGEDTTGRDDAALWDAAVEGRNPAARRALDLFASALGNACGDLVLAHGSTALVLCGGILARYPRLLDGTPFFDRLESKGRFSDALRNAPVLLATLPELGLTGAALALV